MTQTSTTADVTTHEESATRVVLCINELDLGGAEKALVRFAKGLKASGWSVIVVSLRDSGILSQALSDSGIAVLALGAGARHYVRPACRLARLLRQERPAVLVCFLNQANIVGRVAARFAGVPVVVSGVRVADRRKFVCWGERLTWRLCDRHIAVSYSVAELHGKLCGIPRDRFSVIPNGVQIPERGRPERNPDDEKFRILFVGRLTRQKAPIHLLQALHQLPTELRDRVEMNYVGDGELRDTVIEQSRAMGLDRVVNIRGQQSDVLWWMHSSDLLVLPSEWEGLPNVVLEAMAAGLPVIATRVDGVPELIHDAYTGWLVNAGDTAALAKKIAEVAQDPANRDRVARAATLFVRQKFSWDSAIGAFEKLLIQLTDVASDTGLSVGNRKD